MSLLRKFVIGLAGFMCLLALSLLIVIATMNGTIMDRVTVKRWLNDSHIYQTDFVALFTQQAATDAPQDDELYAQSGGTLSGQALVTALSRTFDAAFIQQQTENILDHVYDYSEGKQASFGFSIPLDQKRDTFIQELTKSLAIEVAKLPICTNDLLVSGTYCRPESVSVEQLASQAAMQQVAQFGLFDKPFTSSSFVADGQSAGTSPADAVIASLPLTRSVVNVLFIVLPIVTIASLGIIALAAVRGSRLSVFLKLSKHLFWVMLFSLVVAVATSLIMANNNGGLIALLGGSSNQIAMMVEPLVEIVTVDVSNYTAIVTGIICLTCAAAWAALSFVRKKQLKHDPEPTQPVNPAAVSPAPVVAVPAVSADIPVSQPPHGK